MRRQSPPCRGRYTHPARRTGSGTRFRSRPRTKTTRRNPPKRNKRAKPRLERSIKCQEEIEQVHGVKAPRQDVQRVSATATTRPATTTPNEFEALAAEGAWDSVEVAEVGVTGSTRPALPVGSGHSKKASMGLSLRSPRFCPLSIAKSARSKRRFLR